MNLPPYIDDTRTKIVERVFEFPAFGPIAPGQTSPVNTLPIISATEDHMRLVALRGGLRNSDTLPLTGLELGQLLLDVSILGTEHLSNLAAPCEFSGLFTEQAPWFYFTCPPRVRHREALFAQVVNTSSAATLTPYVQALLVDESAWLELWES